MQLRLAHSDFQHFPLRRDWYSSSNAGLWDYYIRKLRIGWHRKARGAAPYCVCVCTWKAWRVLEPMRLIGLITRCTLELSIYYNMALSSSLATAAAASAACKCSARAVFVMWTGRKWQLARWFSWGCIMISRGSIEPTDRPTDWNSEPLYQIALQMHTSKHKHCALTVYMTSGAVIHSNSLANTWRPT